MKGTDFRTAYDYLIRVFREEGYLHIVMKENSNKRVKRLVFGVVEKYYELDYIVTALAKNGVKNNVKPMLYLGAYSLLYMDTPVGVVLNETAEALEEIGKGAMKNFAFAILSKITKKEYELPKKSDKRYVEVKYNLPSWVVGMYKKDYPNTFEEIIGAKEYPLVHIRLNKNITAEELVRADKNAVKTMTGYFVRMNKEIELLAFLGKITYMSFGSTLVAESMEVGKRDTVLDVCAAPGGKSVYMAQKGGSVTACDVHDHRVELIRSYAERMKTPVTVYKQDGTETVHKWIGQFDKVLVDAPCSGFGVIGKKRDVVFNRTYEDVKNLSELQGKILDNASKYVKRGGVLTYSTCTVFSMENGDVIKNFLESHREFQKEKINLPYENDGEIQFLPDGKGMEGFYVCRMRKA